MTKITALAGAEFRIALRNRWVAIIIATMMLFSLVLAAVGNAPSGIGGIDRLSVTVASLTGLAVYLVPLVALLMAFDAVAGEVERGTLALMLTYPVSRTTLLLAKLIAHLGILALALALGYGAAAALAFATDPQALSGLASLLRLFWTSLLLGACFLGLGYAISAFSGRPGPAAGLAIGVWLVLIVLYDLGLLAAIVADDGGVFTRNVFAWLLVANPADAFRLYNLSASGATAVAAGVGGAASTVPPAQVLTSITVWPVAAFLLALASFRKVVP